MRAGAALWIVLPPLYRRIRGDMHVMFRAIGPDFRHGYAKPQKFANTCIYPLLAHLLGITPAPCDGSLSEVSDMLAR